jgi:hypothetical protein
LHTYRHKANDGDDRQHFRPGAIIAVRGFRSGTRRILISHALMPAFLWPWLNGRPVRRDPESVSGRRKQSLAQHSTYRLFIAAPGIDFRSTLKPADCFVASAFAR